MRAFAYEALIAPLLLLLWPSVCHSQTPTEDSFSAERKRMVQEQLAAPGRDIKNSRVLDAMATVPRREFLPEAEQVCLLGRAPANRLRPDNFPAIYRGIHD